MRRLVLPVLVVIVLALIAVIDLAFFPDQHLALLYVVPLALVAFRAPLWGVMLTATAVFVLDFLSFYVENAPPEVWLLSFIAIVLVCFLAFLRVAERPIGQ